MEKMSVRDISLLYDQQFNQKIKVAKFLLKHLNDKKEVQLATKWLVRVSSIKSPVLEVKKNRNAFLSYVIKVLRDGILEECSESESGTICDPDNSLAFLDYPGEVSKESIEEIEENTVKRSSLEFHSKWSKDHRTYVAIKPISDRGALIYMAVSKYPGLKNWDLPAIGKTFN